MGMSLEQVIADCEEEISDCQIDLDGIAKLLEEYPERKEAFAHEIDDYKKRIDYNRQLAEWLRELAERRKQPEIIRCGECVNFVERDFCKVAGHNVHRKSNCMKVFGAKRRTDG